MQINVSPVLNRIFYSNLQELHLADTTITYFEYKKLAIPLRHIQLYGVTVRDKYGIEIRVADLMKEVLSTIEIFK